MTNDDYEKKQQEHIEWLNGLKAGDTVGVENTNTWRGTTWEKLVVKKVTPTRVVVLSDGARFKCGVKSNGGGFHRLSWKLVPWTAEIEATIERNELVDRVRYYLDRSNTDHKKVDALPDAELKALLKLLRPLRNGAVS